LTSLVAPASAGDSLRVKTISGNRIVF